MSGSTEATIVIAAYNARDTLDRSLSSALAQQQTEAEVLVVDDASTDATWELLQRRSDIRPFRLPANGGPSAARNRALDAARGDWVVVLDSDDTMDPARVRQMIDRAEAAGADVLLGNFRYMTPEGSPEGGDYLPPDDPAADGPLSLEDYVTRERQRPGVKCLGYLKPVMRRAFLEEHGLRYDPALRNGEDCHLIFAALAAGGRVLVDLQPSYNYTVRPGSISYRIDADHILALVAADGRFVDRHGTALSPATRARFAERGEGLKNLVHSEQLLQALKSGRIGEVGRLAAGRPAALPRVLRQLREAAARRLPV